MVNNIEYNANHLLDFIECAELPVDIREIARRCNYNIRSYSSCKSLIKKLSAEDIVLKYPSISFKYDGAYYILLSDNLTRDEESKLIAHEIGHIQLHSLNGYDILGLHIDGSRTETQEAEADEFAIHLLAPTVLLNRYKIKDPAGIKELTGLSLADSQTAFENLRRYREECCIISSRNRLLERHKSCFKPKAPLRKVLVPLLCCLSLVFVATLSTSSARQNKPSSGMQNMQTSEVCDNSSLVDLKQNGYPVLEPTKKANAAEETDSKIVLSDSATYYWTHSGTVYHYFKNCQSLKNSTEIKSGTLEDAKSTKPRLCKFCEDKLN